MRFFARLCVYVIVAAGLFVGLFSLINSRFTGQSDVSQLILESRRSEALRRRSQMVLHNIAVKRTVVDEIVAGRLTLREAATRFQEANELVENNDPELVPDYQTPATEEGVYQQVLAWMRAEVASMPEERAERILAPLVKEYETLFGPLELTSESPGVIGP